MRRLVVSSLLAAIFAAPIAYAQSVISVRSGVLNYSEGAVFIDNKPIERRFGTFTTLKEGSDLLTQDGRAELLLTPNAYLRIGQDSAVRMISASLTDTRVELLSGSAIFDSANAPAGAPITLIVKGAEVRVEKPSRLRIDAEPPQLRVYDGIGVVRRGGGGKETQVDADQRLFLADSSVVQRMTDGSDDLLDIWNQQRNRLIYLNISSAQTIGDPGVDSDVNAGGGSVDAYLGYLPPAGISPMTGFGLYSGGPYYGGPMYGGFGTYPYSGYSFYGVGYRAPGVGFGYASGYRYTPLYQGAYRPGTIRALTPGYGAWPSQPIRGGISVGRPAVPHIPAHR
jgi:hypothetical protein